MMQKKIFIENEGNAWFERNCASAVKVDPASILLKKYFDNKQGNILEIGCSDGRNLQPLQGERYGIDPSSKAIEAGKIKYPDMHLFAGTADNLPFEDNFFDVVFFGFCLYLVDRQDLFKVASEANRVLKNQGFVIVKDFDAPFPIKRQYCHYDGIYSYKQNYENIFLSHPIYTMVEKISYSHQGSSFVSDINERIATTVLYKDINKAYVDL